jgi:hypothetical protein
VAGAFHQDAPHRLGGRREEMTAAVPRPLLTGADQPEVSFMDQSRGLERLPGRFAG